LVEAIFYDLTLNLTMDSVIIIHYYYLNFYYYLY